MADPLRLRHVLNCFGVPLMSSIDAMTDTNWQRQAERLRDHFERAISTHQSEYSVGLAVEFAMVQDTRVTGLVGLGEPLFNCVHHLARSQLKTYGEKLPITRLWGGQVATLPGAIGCGMWLELATGYDSPEC